MTRLRHHHRRPGLVLGVLLLALAGCVSIPETGTVRTEKVQQAVGPDAPVDYEPGGPKPGSTTLEITKGFILAMQATPLNTVVARQFLTAESSSSWVPEKGTVVFGRQMLTTHGRGVTVRLRDTVQLDGRGKWLGDLTGGEGIDYKLRLVREKGEWRISNPPDELVVPQSDFEARFQQYFLYFFDKTTQVLVPEPVYLPRGEQVATLLVAGLLKGPDQGLLGVERTFIPARTEYEISVPVSRTGIADVPLNDEVLDLPDEDLNLVLAQLAWTLRQVPGVLRMRVTVDGSPLDLPGDGTEPSVDAWDTFDPAVQWSSRALFGVREGEVVTVTGTREEVVTGRLSSDGGVRSIAVSLTGDRVAAVTRDGGSLLVQGVGSETAARPAEVLYKRGTDLLKPAWDINDQVWLVDRTAAGARLAVIGPAGREVLDAPGITGEDVAAFALSRDGTRLAVVVSGPRQDRVLLARVLRDHDGRVRRVAQGVRLAVGSQAGDIRDVGWNTPTSVAVLVAPSFGTSQVVIGSVDGSSPLGDVAAVAEVLQEDTRRILTAPFPGAGLYVGTRSGQLYELASNGHWSGTGIEPGLRSPTFVG